MRALSGPILFAGFLIVLLALEALILLYPHALVVNGHEGDLLHTLDAATRLSLGEWPHSGFMTPLGVLAVAPISLFMALGFGPGISFRLGMILVAAVLLPIIWYVGETRLGPRLKYFFGAWLIIMTTGLVYGGDQATSSISMYYNRWSWSAVFLIGVLVLVPSKSAVRNHLEGAMIGGLLALLVLIKLTGFVAIAPAVLLSFLLNRDWERAIACGAAGLLVALSITIAAGGPVYWWDYLKDILFLAQDSARTKPGLDFTSVIANPTYLPGSLCLVMSAIILRMFSRKKEGLLLLVLAPGLFYITFQNWGNDPTWLFLLACLMLALRPEAGKSSLFSIDVRAWHNGLALAALILIAPSMLNVTYSTVRSAALQRADMVAAFPEHTDVDLLVARERAYSPSGKMPLDPVRDENGTLGAPAKTIDFAGQKLSECSAQTGLMGMYQDIARDMQEVGLAGQKILVTDVVNPLWLFGAGQRIPGLAPWYYGGAEGIFGADYVIVALCPFKPDSRKLMIEELKRTGQTYDFVARKPHYLLFKRAGLQG